jgi:hypothetical protein
VLFKESLSRYEESNAEKLPEILKMIWVRIKSQAERPTGESTTDSNFKDQPKKSESSPSDQGFLEQRRSAQDLAQIVMAVAIKLIGDTPIELDDATSSIVNNEIERVIRADGIRMPEWMAKTFLDFDGIDYSRYRPRGFYDRSESLRRYFRAVSWLQSIPFRVDVDKELLAIYILGKTLADFYSGDYSKRLEIEQWFRCYNDLVGQREGWDLLMASQIVRSRPLDLETVRSYLAKFLSEDKMDSEIRDQLGVTPETMTVPASAEFRIIFPHRTPDAILFQRTTSLPNFNRDWPNGLEICAVLGSEFAGQLFAAKVPSANRPAMIALLEDSKRYFKTDSLYNRYLNCLAALLDESEPDAPAFINSRAWKAKSCNTTLAGWSQIRHTWTSQAKQTLHTIGGAKENLPSGFVEPEPEFFARLGELVESARLLLARCGDSVPPRHLVAKDLRAFARLIEKMKYPPDKQAQVELSREQIAVIERSIMTLSALSYRHFSPEDIALRRQDFIAEVLEFAKEVESGSHDGDPAFQAVILDNHFDITPLWDELGDTLRRLEVLAHKQLRGVAFSKQENYFIADFGQKLAFIMLYGGDSYRYPKDSVPHAVDVYSNPEVDSYFHVGIARPRELLVLYPYKGSEILCQGAVIPYYEFISPKQLTDAKWQKRLDSDERPEIPDWLKPIFAPGDPQLIDYQNHSSYRNQGIAR